MKIFAHRGFSAQYPENTMLAFQRALETGCDGIELDVHFSRDRQLVIIHDDSLSRTMDAVGFVRHHTYHDLKNYHVKGNYEGERLHMPTLAEYLDYVKDYPIITNIELKNDKFRYPEMEQAVVEMVKAKGMADKVVLSSFRAESIQQIRAQYPEMLCAWLVDRFDEHTLDRAKSLGCQAIHPLFRTLDKEKVEQCHRMGLVVRAYTVNSNEEMERAQEFGVDAIFTNDPQRGMKAVGRTATFFPKEALQKAEELEKAPSQLAKQRMKLSRRTKKLSGGLLGIVLFMILSVVGSVLVALVVQRLLSPFLS